MRHLFKYLDLGAPREPFSKKSSSSFNGGTPTPTISTIAPGNSNYALARGEVNLENRVGCLGPEVLRGFEACLRGIGKEVGNGGRKKKKNGMEGEKNQEDSLYRLYTSIYLYIYILFCKRVYLNVRNYLFWFIVK